MEIIWIQSKQEQLKQGWSSLAPFAFEVKMVTCILFICRIAAEFLI